MHVEHSVIIAFNLTTIMASKYQSSIWQSLPVIMDTRKSLLRADLLRNCVHFLHESWNMNPEIRILWWDTLNKVQYTYGSFRMLMMAQDSKIMSIHVILHELELSSYISLHSEYPHHRSFTDLLCQWLVLDVVWAGILGLFMRPHKFFSLCKKLRSQCLDLQ